MEYSNKQFGNEIYNSLPKFFKLALEPLEDTERDMMLISFLTSISSMMRNVTGLYQNDWICPNLFSIIVAPAASGKGKMKWAKEIVLKIENELYKESKEALKEHKLLEKAMKKAGQPFTKEKPPFELLIIPTNITSAMLIKQLSENSGNGLMYDTEIDSLVESNSGSLRSFSDDLRKIYEGEQMGVMRKTGSERVKIPKPKMSLLLSGTPSQFHKLIPDSENGLFSRIIAFHFKGKSNWRSSYNSEAVDFKKYYQELSEKLYDYFEILRYKREINFHFSDRQYELFDTEFRKRLESVHTELGNVGRATVLRLGSITFKIAMIFNTIRCLDNEELRDVNICCDDDFNNSLHITEKLLVHSISALKLIKENKAASSFSGKKLDYFYGLEQQFTFKESQNLAKDLKIKLKTAEKWIYQFQNEGLIKRIKKGEYSKNI